VRRVSLALAVAIKIAERMGKKSAAQLLLATMSKKSAALLVVGLVLMCLSVVSAATALQPSWYSPPSGWEPEPGNNHRSHTLASATNDANFDAGPIDDATYGPHGEVKALPPPQRLPRCRP
jgi:hypothetical protein